VAEPCECGPGGDGFAQVWFGGELHAINGSGRAPLDPGGALPEQAGPRSVTVPGLVAMWADLSERWGRLGLDRCLQPAIALAESGIAVTNRIAKLWDGAAQAGRAPFPAPRVGQRYRMPDLARTLRAIAEHGTAAVYDGAIAAAIADATWLSRDDLRRHQSEWVEPLRLSAGDVEVCEVPPNSQAIAALQALAIFRDAGPDDPAGRLHRMIEAMKIALADARRHVGDAPPPVNLLAEPYITACRELIRADRALAPQAAPQAAGGTSYLCVVDEERNAVSLIQSLFHHFGSGVTPAGTGITLQNRGAGFAAPGDGPGGFVPGTRPYHTLMPGMLIERGRLVGPFGVMGGAMQPQGHLQVITGLLDDHVNPQAALDAARFRVEPDGSVLLEPGLWHLADDLRGRGHTVTEAGDPSGFGVGQVIICHGDVLAGGSDGRGDGMAGGY
jgi:gamma-glutamyltranspeptidase/glutathione hydrolase